MIAATEHDTVTTQRDSTVSWMGAEDSSLTWNLANESIYWCLSHNYNGAERFPQWWATILLA